jgi:hypothetical protein
VLAVLRVSRGLMWVLRGAAGEGMSRGAEHGVVLLVVRPLPRDIDDSLTVAADTGKV